MQVLRASGTESAGTGSSLNFMLQPLSDAWLQGGIFCVFYARNCNRPYLSSTLPPYHEK